MTLISDNLSRVQDRIAAAARRAKRDESSITLVAVTKTHPAETVAAAIEAGLRHFGENRVEEATDKIPAVGMRYPEIVWHMIGHVQSRKAAKVAGLFDTVHSVESIKLVRRLSRFAGEQRRVLKVLLEFNLSGDENKDGFKINGDNIDHDVRLLRQINEIVALPSLQIDGLMTMAPIVADPEQARPVFRALRELRNQLSRRYATNNWQHLSMGMTDDFEVAIEEGATLIRVGRAIFGARKR